MTISERVFIGLATLCGYTWSGVGVVITHDQPWASNPRSLDLVQHPIHHTHPKNPIHQVTTLLATSKDILFPGHNHLLTTSASYLAIDHLHWRSANHQSEGSSAPVVSRW